MTLTSGILLVMFVALALVVVAAFLPQVVTVVRAITQI